MNRHHPSHRVYAFRHRGLFSPSIAALAVFVASTSLSAAQPNPDLEANFVASDADCRGHAGLPRAGLAGRARSRRHRGDHGRHRRCGHRRRGRRAGRQRLRPVRFARGAKAPLHPGDARRQPHRGRHPLYVPLSHSRPQGARERPPYHRAARIGIAPSHRRCRGDVARQRRPGDQRSRRQGRADRAARRASNPHRARGLRGARGRRIAGRQRAPGRTLSAAPAGPERDRRLQHRCLGRERAGRAFASRVVGRGADQHSRHYGRADPRHRPDAGCHHQHLRAGLSHRSRLAARTIAVPDRRYRGADAVSPAFWHRGFAPALHRRDQLRGGRIFGRGRAGDRRIDRGPRPPTRRPKQNPRWRCHWST